MAGWCPACPLHAGHVCTNAQTRCVVHLIDRKQTHIHAHLLMSKGYVLSGCHYQKGGGICVGFVAD